jgi:hypothetical protein
MRDANIIIVKWGRSKNRQDEQECAKERILHDVGRFWNLIKDYVSFPVVAEFFQQSFDLYSKPT